MFLKPSPQTGACAAVVCGRLDGRLGPEVEVKMPGGTLRVCWEGVGERQGVGVAVPDLGTAVSMDEPVWLMGHVATTFTGVVRLPATAGAGADSI